MPLTSASGSRSSVAIRDEDDSVDCGAIMGGGWVGFRVDLLDDEAFPLRLLVMFPRARRGGLVVVVVPPTPLDPIEEEEDDLHTPMIMTVFSRRGRRE